MDALVVARVSGGHRAYLLEWKYCQEYLHPDDKGLGRSGDTRRSRYQHLYRKPESSFNQTVSLDDFFFEPFYQIMRLRLMADRMVASGVSSLAAQRRLFNFQVCPYPYVVRRPQGSINFTRVVEAKTAIHYLQWSCNPDIVNASVKTLPIRVGYGAVDLLQGGKGSWLGLGGAKGSGHKLGRRHVQSRIEVATYYSKNHVVPTVYPVQKLLYLVKSEGVLSPRLVQVRHVNINQMPFDF